jgi:Flp pilus assembly pilin Flp
MLNLYCKIKALRATHDKGVTTVEYALLVAALVLVVAGAVTALMWGINDAFSKGCDAVSTNCGGGGGGGG